MIHGSFDA